MKNKIGLRIKSYRMNKGYPLIVLANKLYVDKSELEECEEKGVSNKKVIHNFKVYLEIDITEYQINDILIKKDIFDHIGIDEFNDSVRELINNETLEFKDWEYLQNFIDYDNTDHKYSVYDEAHINELLNMARLAETSTDPNIQTSLTIFKKSFSNVLLGYAYNLVAEDLGYKQKCYITDLYDIKEIRAYDRYMIEHNVSENYQDVYGKRDDNPFEYYDSSNDKPVKKNCINNYLDRIKTYASADAMLTNDISFILYDCIYNYVVNNEKIRYEDRNIYLMRELVYSIENKVNESQSEFDIVLSKMKDQKNNRAYHLYRIFKAAKKEDQKEAIYEVLNKIEKSIEKCVEEISEDEHLEIGITASRYGSFSSHFYDNETIEHYGFTRINNKKEIYDACKCLEDPDDTETEEEHSILYDKYIKYGSKS